MASVMATYLNSKEKYCYSYQIQIFRVLLDSRDTWSPLDCIFHEFLLYAMVESKVWGRGHSNLRKEMIGGERKPKSPTWHNPELTC